MRIMNTLKHCACVALLAFVACLPPHAVYAASNPVLPLSTLSEMAKAASPQMTEWRHYFHANPELPWKEYGTSAKIAELLREMGYENIKIGFNGTKSGVVAELNAGKPGKLIAIRADMDALPLQEQNSVPYKSTVPGVFHGCGHDAHMAGALGAAKVLAQMKDQLPGRVRFIFQPAEEVITGAKTLIDAGVLDGVDFIIGAHTAGGVSVGLVDFRSGPTMASADIVKVNIYGRGGHGAMPQVSIDPIVASATIITTLQTIVSREINPQYATVITVGHFEAGKVANVIPDMAEMDITVRTLNPEVRKSLEERIRRVVSGIAEAMRCTSEVTYTYGVPVLVNDPAQTELARSVAVEILGDNNVRSGPMKMASEDFSYYLEKVPGTFFYFGVANDAKGMTAANHNTKFDVDDDSLWIDTAILAGYVARALAN